VLGREGRGRAPGSPSPWSRVGLLLAVAAVVVLAYVGRNQIVTGHPVLADNGPYNLYRGNGPVYQEDLNLFAPRATADQIAYRKLRAADGLEPPLTLTPAEMQREAFSYIRAHPGLFARRALGRLARLTVPRTEHLTLLGGEERIRIEDGRAVALMLLGMAEFAPLLWLGTVGLVGLRRQARPWGNRFCAVVVGGVPPALIAISKPRFGFVFEPLLLIATAAFLLHAQAWRPLLRRPGVIAISAFYAWAWVAWLIFGVTSRAPG
jgi:hypothetical protein